MNKPLGINLGGYAYWTTGLPFTNFSTISDDWRGGLLKWSTTPVNPIIKKTRTGYPAVLDVNQSAMSLVCMGQGGKYPIGQYILTWSGDADVRIKSGWSKIISSKPKEIIYEITSTSGSGLPIEVTRVNPADPVRDICLKQTSTNMFRSEYLDDLKRYNLIRFMDWGSTNGHKNAIWANRVRPEDAHYGTSLGVPYETMIALCNQIGKDCWICIPHMADDDYVQQLASLVKRDLNSNLKVYIEYSNEVWNWAFAQAKYAETTLRTKYNVSNYLTAYGKRAAEIFTLFNAICPCVRVLGAQGANWGTWQYIAASGVQADVIAIAPYFGLDIDTLYSKYLAGSVTIDDSIFAALKTNIDKVLNLSQWLTFGLPLIAYEGGQHLVARPGEQHNNVGFVTFLRDINRDVRMGDCYRYYLDQWYAATNNSLMTLFNDVGPASKWGNWGLKEWYGDNDAPKFITVQEYNAN